MGSRPSRHHLIAAFLLTVPATPFAQQPTPAHVHATERTQAHEHESAPQMCPGCPPGREGSGTSWQPDATATHMRTWTLGPWQFGSHVQATLVYTDERGPRGDDAALSTNHGMVRARRALGAGMLGVQTMWSFEPTMGRDGYPLLLQTGETADGVTPLIDRQHPHDFPMELGATYARPLAGDRAVSVYTALVGSPAIGPPAFMHRASAARLPLSPITHHWFDSTHITFGVLTVGFMPSPRVKFEASGFRGREPDEKRWGFEKPGLDSFAFRLSVNPTSTLAVQVSAARLEEPEQLHPGADVVRLSASAMYARRWSTMALDATLAWGRNKRGAAFLPSPGGLYFFQGNVTHGTLAEATLHIASRHHVVSRVELARKDELFDLTDPRHQTVYPVTRATAAYVLDVFSRPSYRVGVGAAASIIGVPAALDSRYGSPGGVLAFIDLAAH